MKDVIYFVTLIMELVTLGIPPFRAVLFHCIFFLFWFAKKETKKLLTTQGDFAQEAGANRRQIKPVQSNALLLIRFDLRLSLRVANPPTIIYF